MSQSTTLFIPETRKPQQAQVSDETAAKIRHQADQVLAKHRNDLPAHIVVLLSSPKISIVAKTITEDVVPWLATHVASQKLELAKAHPKYDEAAALRHRADSVLNGRFGKQVESELDTFAQRILEMDLFQILETQQLKNLGIVVKVLETTRNRLHKAAAKKESRRQTQPAKSLEELFPGPEKRERRPKPAKPAYTGLPPIHTGEVAFANEFHYGVDDQATGGGRTKKPDGEKNRKGGKKGK